MPERQDGPTRAFARRELLGPVATVFANADTGSWRLVKPVVDFAKCLRCGTCARYCPAAVVRVDPRDEAPVQIDFHYCKGCGICANECPADCIEMIPEGGGRHGG